MAQAKAASDPTFEAPSLVAQPKDDAADRPHAAAGEAAGRLSVERVGGLRFFRDLTALPPADLAQKLTSGASDGTLAASVSGAEGAELAALVQVLKRFHGDLAAQTGALKSSLEVIFAAIPDAAVPALEACLEARFGLTSVGNDSSSEMMPMVQASLGMTAEKSDPRDLRRMWHILETLPPAHVEGLSSLRRIVEAHSTSNIEGVEFGDSQLASLKSIFDSMAGISQADIQKVIAMYRAQVSGTVMVELSSQSGDDFDHVFRHEVGHAVDDTLGGSRTYGTTAAGGGWSRFGSFDEVLTWAFAATHLDALSPAQQQDARHYLTATYGENAAVTKMRAAQGLAAPAAVAMPTGMPPAFESLCHAFGDATSAVDDVGHTTPIAGKGLRFLPTGFFSYDMSARARQVSNYQFTSPSEWFAEAYSTYFDPAGPGGKGLSDVGDEATRRYFKEQVVPFAEKKAPAAAPKGR